MTDLLIYPMLVFGACLLSGIINIMAGGGSVITLRVLILLGLDPSVANGTNRIGLMVETSSAVLAFKSEKYSEFRESFKLAIFTIPGAILGSYCAVNISDAMFQRLLALVMIFVVVSLLLPKPVGNLGEEVEKIKGLLIPCYVRDRFIRWFYPSRGGIFDNGIVAPHPGVGLGSHQYA